MPKRISVRERILATVDQERSPECWMWLGVIDRDGYARIKVDAKLKAAHRVSHEEFIGPIPLGLEIDHLCRNRACVNPSHLEAVTHAENIARAFPAQERCSEGHDLIPTNLIPRSDGRRGYCRKCHNARARDYKRRQRTSQ